MSSTNMESIFGSNNERSRKQRDPLDTFSVERGDLIPYPSSTQLGYDFAGRASSSPLSPGSNSLAGGRERHNANNPTLNLDYVEPENESSLMQKTKDLLSSDASEERTKRKVQFLHDLEELEIAQEQGKLDLRMVQTKRLKQLSYNYFNIPQSKNQNALTYEVPQQGPMLLLGASPVNATTPASVSDSEKIITNIGQVKKKFIEINGTSLFRDTPILDKENLVHILLELSSATSLEDFNSHIKMHLKTIAKESFVFMYCVLFYKLSLLIQLSYKNNTLSFDKDFNIEEVAALLTKINFDLRCRNNRNKKKEDKEESSETNPFSTFTDVTTQMNLGYLTNENMRKSIELLNQVEGSKSFTDWIEKKENAALVTTLHQYEEKIFGLTSYPVASQILSENKSSILNLLFIFLHFPIQNAYHMIFDVEYSSGNYSYYRLTPELKEVQKKSMTDFKKSVKSLFMQKPAVKSSETTTSGTTSSSTSGRNKRRQNRFSCNFKDFLNDESISKLERIEGIFTMAKEERSYSMIKLDVYREVFATLLIIKACSESLLNDGNFTISVSKVKICECIFNISTTGTKSTMETNVTNLLSLLPSPASKRYNFLNYLFNYWETLEASEELHTMDLTNTLKVKEFEKYKKEFILFHLGMSVF